MKSSSLAVPAALNQSGTSSALRFSLGTDHQERYASVDELIRHTRPAEPVYCLRPHTVHHAARWFLTNFPGRVMYSVKSNPEPVVLRTLYAAGVSTYDVASLPEVKLIAEMFPDAEMFFMHPVKAPEAIREAYFRYGVKHYSLDSFAELEKIMAATNMADDLTLHLRLDVSSKSAFYSLAGKFGIKAEEAAPLLQAMEAVAQKVGICFHVGSQCMNPLDYRSALEKALELVAASGVTLSYMDIGGGFPSVYPGMTPPKLGRYMDVIRESLEDLGLEDMEILCEPGRALVAESGSTIARVELRKGNSLYLNEGTFGSLFDAGAPGWLFPTRAFSDGGKLTGELVPFQFFGPTCDSLDVMKGPFLLPDDISEGDWIEIGQLGAYGTTMRTRFNGFHSERLVEVEDAPMLTLFQDP